MLIGLRLSMSKDMALRDASLCQFTVIAWITHGYMEEWVFLLGEQGGILMDRRCIYFVLPRLLSILRKNLCACYGIESC